MKPPVAPAKEDCCNSGCNPCILDVYENQLKLYEKSQKQGDNSFSVTDYGISQLEYKKFYLCNIIQVSNTQKILFFQKSKHDQCQQVWWKPGDHFLLKYTSVNNESCTRAYTPIKLKLHGKEQSYDFLILLRKYSKGLVSNYLFNLTIGEETLWRGPYGSYKIQANKYVRIIMIAQGTGIAPFISIIQNILDNEEDMTRIVLFYCCKDTVEIFLRDELYEFNSFWNFSYKIFLSNKLIESSDENAMNRKYNEPIVNNKFSITELDNLIPHLNDQYLLCGTVQFMKEYEAVLKNGNYSDNIFLF
ncbi:NADH-cytochrome b5 reductase-like [Maniola jurtina]|uniref:NADH-cytochrome b5 reductase-like n=1 Tax=Maniola jurtina TaxID=191418 RepID=UPI001E6879AF|nr:NADH-cytochrome b5 reductase-like [Maniola jurtina]